jgi:hypothetical protein
VTALIVALAAAAALGAILASHARARARHAEDLAHKAEMRSREQELRFRRLADALPVGVTAPGWL